MIISPKNLSTKFSLLVNSFNKVFKRIQQTLCLLKEESTSLPCFLCEESINSNDHFCIPCHADLPDIQSHCRQCSLPLSIGNHGLGDAPLTVKPQLICGECIQNSPSFSQTICAFRYEFPIQQIIHKIKFNQERYWVSALSKALYRQINSIAMQDHAFIYPELLIPIPLHKTKYKLRGFNQANLIACRLAKLSKLPLADDVLIKVQPTDTQTQLNKSARLKNLKGSMTVPAKKLKQISGKHIALIDDVMTTKATAEVASQALLLAGARRVDIWCIARTPKNRPIH